MKVKSKSVPPQEFVERLRIYIEKRYGHELRSALLRNVEFYCREQEEPVIVDVYRFFQHFPYKESVEPYLDLFINPLSNKVVLNVCDGTTLTQELEPNVTLKDVEVFFAALVLNSEKTKEGIRIPVKKHFIH